MEFVVSGLTFWFDVLLVLVVLNLEFYDFGLLCV